MGVLCVCNGFNCVLNFLFHCRADCAAATAAAASTARRLLTSCRDVCCFGSASCGDDDDEDAEDDVDDVDEDERDSF